ncbi:major facilitator superfamily domain-containing protein, partial [Piptocephalis cylindrospora]
FSAMRKNCILAIVAFAGILGPLTSTVFLPAIRDLQRDLHTTLTIVNLCISLFVLFMCTSPFVWAPLSEMIGRKPIFLISTALFTGASAGCALSPSAGLFVPMRVLQAIGSASGQVVGAGVIADIFEAKERGTRMGIFFMGPLLGPVLGPFVGGFITQNLGWRWVFWIPCILGGSVLLSILLLLPETLPSPKPLGPFNPLTPLRFFKDPNVSLMVIYPGVTYGLMYFLLTNYSPTISRTYGWNTSQTGVSFLAGGIGNILGTFVGGWLADWGRSRALRKSEGSATPEMRLTAFWIGALLMPIGFIIFGWTLQAKTHFAIPLIGYFIEGFGQLMGFSITNTYFVDAYATKAASVIGTATFVRGIMGMITPLFAVQMQAALDIGWTYTILAIISLLCAIPVFIVKRWGVVWRQ